MDAVVRHYSDTSALADVIDQKLAEVEQILRGVPGVVAYYAFRTGAGVATVTIAEDQAGTQESSRRAADWSGSKGCLAARDARPRSRRARSSSNSPDHFGRQVLGERLSRSAEVPFTGQ
jgi:hypothetical protein